MLDGIDFFIHVTYMAHSCNAYGFGNQEIHLSQEQKYRVKLLVAVPASALGPGVDYIAKHIGLALGVPEIPDVVLVMERVVSKDELETLSDVLATRDRIDSLTSHLRNGPNAVTVRNIEIAEVARI